MAIVDSLHRRLATTPLAEISADDLAADANISRVTFFNYFPTKDHAVDLLMAILLFRIEVASAKSGVRGLAAIEGVFATFVAELAEAPERMRRLVGYFAVRDAGRPLPSLGEEDLALLEPAVPRDLAPTGHLGALLIRFVEEAFADGQLPREATSYELAHYLGSLLNGIAMVGHSSPDTDFARLARRHVWRALGERSSDRKVPAPPAVPARYRTKKGGPR